MSRDLESESLVQYIRRSVLYAVVSLQNACGGPGRENHRHMQPKAVSAVSIPDFCFRFSEDQQNLEVSR